MPFFIIMSIILIAIFAAYLRRPENRRERGENKAIL